MVPFLVVVLTPSTTDDGFSARLGAVAAAVAIDDVRAFSLTVFLLLCLWLLLPLADRQTFLPVIHDFIFIYMSAVGCMARERERKCHAGGGSSYNDLGLQGRKEKENAEKRRKVFLSFLLSAFSVGPAVYSSLDGEFRCVHGHFLKKFSRLFYLVI